VDGKIDELRNKVDNVEQGGRGSCETFKANGITFFYKALFEPLKRHEVTRVYRTEAQIIWGGTFQRGQILTVKYLRSWQSWVDGGKVRTRSEFEEVGRVMVTNVVAVETEKITDEDVKKAGFSSKKDFLRTLGFPPPVLVQVDFEWL
jgi:hypothetical protein